MNHRDIIQRLTIARSMSTFGPDFSKKEVQIGWASKLESLNPESFNKALNALAGNREFPAVNEIVNFCKGINQELDMAPEEAFNLLWLKIGSVGGYHDPELPNEIGLAVERLGGWRFICSEWTDEKKPWHEKSFREVYQNLQQTKSQHALPTSKYSPEALEGNKPKQISGQVNEALRMAMSGPGKGKPSLVNIFREIKKSEKP